VREKLDSSPVSGVSILSSKFYNGAFQIIKLSGSRIYELSRAGKNRTLFFFQFWNDVLVGESGV